MTHAMLRVLKSNTVKTKRKQRNASLQYVFNRMVEEMPEEEEEEMVEGEMEENEEFEYNFMEFDEEEGEFDDWEQE